MINTPDSFYGLGIAPGLLEVLDSLKFRIPTPIQHKTIPLGLEGKDIIGVAQTGTGKTLAFGIPMIQRLAQKKGKGLILVPTRELAIQINETIKKLAPTFKIKTVVLIGGESLYMQILALRRDNPRIIIATPGRLIDQVGQHNIRLNDVEILVIDEADRLMDMGFMPQLVKIIQMIPVQRQTLLFSATIPPGIVKLASTYMHLPVHTEIAPSGTAPETVTHEIFVVNRHLKEKLLGELLKQYTGSVLLFVRTKIRAWKMASTLKKMGHSCAEIHSDRTLFQRKEALAGFKLGKYRILVATDIAARGLDVTGIELVLNYDLPDDPENYVHRIGRTGRAGQKGHAISLATPDQRKDVQNIEKIIRTTIPLSEHPHVPLEKLFSAAAPGAAAAGPAHRPRPFGRRFGRRSHRRR